MAKTVFSKGDAVNAKKWSGTSFLGIYEQTYDDGSHCVVEVTSGKRFNVHLEDVKMASEEDAKEIKKLSKENNVKPREDDSKTYVTGKTTPKEVEEPKVDEELEAALEAVEED
jgi:hypothetical protein